MRSPHLFAVVCRYLFLLPAFSAIALLVLFATGVRCLLPAGKTKQPEKPPAFDAWAISPKCFDAAYYDSPTDREREQAGSGHWPEGTYSHGGEVFEPHRSAP